MITVVGQEEKRLRGLLGESGEVKEMTSRSLQANRRRRRKKEAVSSGCYVSRRR